MEINVDKSIVSKSIKHYGEGDAVCGMHGRAFRAVTGN